MKLPSLLAILIVLPALTIIGIVLSILSALVGFNVGVELGQLAALSLMWPLLGFAEGFARRAGGAPAVRGLTRVGAATTLALGTWWFTGRAFQQLAIGG